MSTTYSYVAQLSFDVPPSITKPLPIQENKAYFLLLTAPPNILGKEPATTLPWQPGRSQHLFSKGGCLWLATQIERTLPFLRDKFQKSWSVAAKRASLVISLRTNWYPSVYCAMTFCNYFHRWTEKMVSECPCAEITMGEKASYEVFYLPVCMCTVHMPTPETWVALWSKPLRLLGLPIIRSGV